MLKRNLVQWAVLPVAMIVACALISPLALGVDSTPTVARVDAFTGPDGVTDVALSLKPGETATAATPRDVVILFSTSASQTGEYREGDRALKGVLAGLGPHDRAYLMAVDLNAISLTKSFAAPNSKDMAAALAALDARPPLGASDMEKAINAVVGSFAADSKNARAAVYIGDGRSSANLLDTEKFKSLTAKLAEARIPLNSYILGGRVDVQLPGALAVQTGGAVITDSDALKGDEAGHRLGSAADATVLWPTTVAWPPEMTEVLPKQLPPLRSDRETVVLGTMKGMGPLNVKLTADSAAGPQKLAFAVPPATSDDNNGYLPRLVDQARIDGGVTLPLVGSASLAAARQEIDAGVHNLSRLAREALSGRQSSPAPSDWWAKPCAATRTTPRRWPSRAPWRSVSRAARRGASRSTGAAAAAGNAGRPGGRRRGRSEPVGPAPGNRPRRAWPKVSSTIGGSSLR